MRCPAGTRWIVATTLGMALGAVTAWAGDGPPPPPTIRFTDTTDAAGITFKHSFGDANLSNIVEGSGAGALAFDYDNDGWLDLYFVNGRHRPDLNDNTGRRLAGKLSNALYHNNKDGTFTDVTATAGVGGGEGYGFCASAADYDRDGDLDLFVGNYGPDTLYRNNGDGTFTDVTKAAGIDDPRWTLSGLWLDYDRDGDADLYLCNYLEYDNGAFRAFYAAAGYPGPLAYHGQPDVMYRNNGDGTFTDVTESAGLTSAEGRGMSATALDLLNTGRLDVFVANDAMENDVFINKGDGTFENQALLLNLAFGEGGQGVSSMGPVFGDVDDDGRLDTFVPDMGYGCLSMNRGAFFEDATNASGIALICGQYTGWGGILQDLDNDGDLDLFITNGDAHHEYGEEAVLAANDGTGRFTDVARDAGPFFEQKLVGRGATYGDFDNDGDIDVVACYLNDRVRLLRNDTDRGANHWLTVRALAPGGKTPALGARVSVTAGGKTRFDDLIPVRGYLSQGDPRPHFGLGTSAVAERVEVRWADGKTPSTVLENVPADQILEVVQPASDAAR
jgi:hypothetical protein